MCEDHVHVNAPVQANLNYKCMEVGTHSFVVLHYRPGIIM